MYIYKHTMSESEPQTCIPNSNPILKELKIIGDSAQRLNQAITVALKAQKDAAEANAAAEAKAAAEANAAAETPAAKTPPAEPAATDESQYSDFVKNNLGNLDMQFKTKTGSFISLKQIIDMLLNNNSCKLLPESKCKEALQRIIKANSKPEVNNIIKEFTLYPRTIQSAGTRKPRMHKRNKTQRKRSKTIRKKNNRK